MTRELSQTPTAKRHRGLDALERAERKAKRTPTARRRGSGVPKAALAPEAMALRAQGHTTREIASMLHRSERYVRELLRYAREDAAGMIMVMPDPVTADNVADWARPMLESTVEGFELFFNAFSGRTLPEHGKEWVQEALTQSNVLLNVPPRHAKSTIITVWFSIWLVARSRDVQILIVSQTSRLAEKFTNEIAYALTYNQKLIETFGRFKPETQDWPWRPNSGELLVDGRRREVKSGDLTIQIRGAGQQILGMECDWVIVDDPTNRGIAESEVGRERENHWIHEEVFSRLNPGGPRLCQHERCSGHAVVIGQRVHPRDIFGTLEKEKRRDNTLVFHTVKYPAVLNWGDADKGIPAQVLWPEERPLDYLMEQYDRVGGYAAFECMFQQNPVPLGTALVRREWIDGDDTHTGCLDRERIAGQAMAYTELDKGFLPITRIISVDPSPKRYTGIVCGDMLWNRDEFVFSVLESSSQQLGERQLIDEIERLSFKYGGDYLIFEESTFSRWLYEHPAFELLKNRFRILGHNTGRNKADPELGVWGMASDFEFGRIRLPYGDAESRAMTEQFVTELMSWPNGHTDDVLMALWFVKFNYKRLVPIRALPTRMSGRRGSMFLERDLENQTWGEFERTREGVKA